MKDKNKGVNLGHFYFDYQSRNFLIQSVRMMDLYLQLAGPNRLKNEIEWELADKKCKVGKKFVSKRWENELEENHKEMLSNPELKGFNPYFADDPIKEGE